MARERPTEQEASNKMANGQIKTTENIDTNMQLWYSIFGSLNSMERTVYIAGNWKMHNTVAESRALIGELRQRLSDPKGVRVIVAPAFTALAAAQQEIGSAPISLAAQNISYADSGAHTAEVSAAMLADLGVRYAIVGHSERRHLYGEDNAMVADRASHALRNNITPIVCVGERLPERENGTHFSVCAQQLTASLCKIEAAQIARVLIAYEPVWAIGTGKTASPHDAEEMHAYLRQSLAKISDQATAERVSILYGGSVKPSNSKELLAQQNIDGALVGGASLNAESFVSIVESIS